MSFEIGGLYICPEYVIFLYPTFSKARQRSGWINEFRRSEAFCVLGHLSEEDELGFCQVEVLVGHTTGWINVASWLGIKKLSV